MSPLYTLDKHLQGFAPAYAPGWQEPLHDYLHAVAATRAAKTLTSYAGALKVLHRWAKDESGVGGGIPFSEFKAAHLRRFMTWRGTTPAAGRQTPVGDKTRRLDALVAKIFFKWAHTENYLDDDPLRGSVLPRLQEFHKDVPTDEQMACLLRASLDRWSVLKQGGASSFSPRRRRFYALRNHAILAGLVATGVRIGEMLALTLSDLPGDGTLIVRHSKSKKPRTIPVPLEWSQMVEAYLRVRPANCPTDFLFVNDAGEPINYNVFRHSFQLDLEFAHLPHFTIHALRHYALTRIARTNPWVAQLVAGHAKIETTRRYLHEDMAHTREVMTQAGPLTKLLVSTKTAKKNAARKRLI